MIPYVIAFFVVGLSGFLYHEKVVSKKLFLITCFLILGTMSALRSENVGVDTITYVNMYPSLTVQGNSRIELLFRALCDVLNFINDNPRTLLIVTGYTITAGFCLFIYRYSKAPFFSVFLLIVFNHYFISMNLMRQMLALVIVLTALPLCKKNKPLFVFFVCVSALFHYSAIVLILYVVLYDIKYSNKFRNLVIAGTALSVLLLPFGLNIVFKFFPQYKIMYMGTDHLNGNTFGTIFEIIRLVGIMIFLKMNGYQKLDKENSFQMNMILMAIVLQVFGTQANIIARVAEYFSIFEIIAIPNVFKSIKFSSQKNFQLFVVLVVAILYFVIVSVFRPGWHGAIPYEVWGSV